MKITKSDVLFSFSLLLALWFALMGMVWVYFAALIVAYPAGLLSLLLWLPISKEDRFRTKIIPAILIIGLALSLLVLVVLLIWN